MSFLQPAPPPFDLEQWRAKPYLSRLKANCQDWAVNGFGSGSMQLTARYGPVIGGVLYWLRPAMVRLPPWPDKVPLTRGTRRAPIDVGLYAGVLAAGVYLLVSSGQAVAGTAAGRLEPAWVAVLLALWALLGLRDKVSFLAGRPEVYGFLLLVSLFPTHNLVRARDRAEVRRSRATRRARRGRR